MIRSILFVTMFTWLGLLATACGNAENKTRTALETISVLLKPAKQFAADQCTREQAALAGDDAKLMASKDRCARAEDAFERIAILEDAATKALDSGNLELAQQILAQVKTLWAGIHGGE